MFVDEAETAETQHSALGTQPSPLSTQHFSLSTFLISLAFWFCLLIAAACFGVVSLAPKVLTYLTLQEQYVTTQHELVALEQQVGQLERVVDALEHDPGYAAELARVDFHAGRLDEERLPVESELVLQPRDRAPRTTGSESLARSIAVVEPFAQQPVLRRGLLLAAAVLVLVAFALLHEGRARHGGLWQRLTARYRRRSADAH